MNKVEFQWIQDKALFSNIMLDLWNFDWNELRLFDRYYLKNKSFIKGINIVLVEFVNDLIQIDKTPVEDLDANRLALLVEFICKLRENKLKKLGAKRKSEVPKSKGRLEELKDYIKINNTLYVEPVNRNSKYEWKIEGGFDVRGHMRTLKSGKKVFIKSYKKLERS